MRLPSPSTVALALGCSLAAPETARACAPAPPAGVTVSIAEESAVIAWDAARRLEHFVRRASFRTRAKDFGFLVPTPTKPELAEAPDAIFAELEDLIRPELRTEAPLLEPTLACGAFFLMRGAAVPSAVPPPVRVLEEKRVAGYDAAVLEADDAAALARWLDDHGYASRPALADWLAPYVARRWKITAFKIASGGEAPPADQAVGSSAVRMSFATERPFFPYREPADQREGPQAPRLLRVFYLADARADGAIEDGAVWPGRPIWSSAHDRLVSIAGPSLPAGALAASPWLTVFEDSASPRPGTGDLYFAKAADPSRIVPPPVILRGHGRVPLPIDLILLAGGVAWLVVRRRRTRRA